MAITNIGVVSVHVKDYDKSIDFFVNQLGFTKTMDAPMGPDMRWVTVAPKADSPTALSLMAEASFPPHVPSLAGKMVNPCIFTLEHFEADCAALKAKGVNFTIEPVKQPWGWWAEIEDVDGNSFGLHANV